MTDIQNLAEKINLILEMAQEDEDLKMECAINWGDLSVREISAIAEKVLYPEEEEEKEYVYFKVLVEEVSPESTALIEFIHDNLFEMTGFQPHQVMIDLGW